MATYAGLREESPLLVRPSLARQLGVNKAIVLEQLNYLLTAAREKNYQDNFVDGDWWVYNSYQQWVDTYFQWLSVSALKGIFAELEASGVVVSRQGVKSRYDRRKWYRIDYAVYDSAIGKKCPIKGTKNVPSKGTKNVPSKGTKNVQTLTKTSTETPSETKDISPIGESRTGYFDQRVLSYLIGALVKHLKTEPFAEIPTTAVNLETTPDTGQLKPEQRRRMQVAIQFALGLEEPTGKSGWQILNRWVSFFTGQIKRDKDRKTQTEWYTEQFADNPYKPVRVVALRLWYDSEMKKRDLEGAIFPKTLTTLRRWADEFELAPNKATALKQGVSKLAALLGIPDPTYVPPEVPASREENDAALAEWEALKQKLVSA